MLHGTRLSSLWFGCCCSQFPRITFGWFVLALCGSFYNCCWSISPHIGLFFMCQVTGLFSNHCAIRCSFLYWWNFKSPSPCGLGCPTSGYGSPHFRASFSKCKLGFHQQRCQQSSWLCCFFGSTEDVSGYLVTTAPFPSFSYLVVWWWPASLVGLGLLTFIWPAWPWLGKGYTFPKIYTWEVRTFETYFIFFKLNRLDPLAKKKTDLTLYPFIGTKLND